MRLVVGQEDKSCDEVERSYIGHQDLVDLLTGAEEEIDKQELNDSEKWLDEAITEVMEYDLRA